MLRFNKIIASLLLLLAMSACNNSNDDDIVVTEPPQVVERQYQVTVANLTNAQPLSPIAVLLHNTGEIWQIGQPASSILENLAESGDNSGILTANFGLSNATNGDVVLPGTNVEIVISSSDDNALYLSLATMLVNTNDAFSGLNRIDLSLLAVNASLNYRVAVYDAGTEGNFELSGTIPGPADGGEGFNEVRDDVDYVAMHPGVVSVDDGLTDSVLDNQHKFDNPAMSVRIVRLQ